MRRINKGIVYILSNESMPNIYKIGCTTQELEKRISQLSRSSSVPKPFNLIAYAIVDDCLFVERIFHKSFLKNTYGKEFFKFTPKQLIYKVCHKFNSRNIKAIGAYKTSHYDQILAGGLNG